LFGDVEHFVEPFNASDRGEPRLLLIGKCVAESLELNNSLGGGSLALQLLLRLDYFNALGNRNLELASGPRIVVEALESPSRN